MSRKKYKERHIYFFKCSDCETENRQSFKRAKAKRGVCRVCRRNIISKDQIGLF